MMVFYFCSMNLLTNNRKPFSVSIIFVILLGAISLLYNYHEIALKKPQSTHKWRQSDCASIAMNYYQGGMKLFKPEVHNLTSKKGTSGAAFTSELPLYYYSIAFLYNIFGPHDYIYRIINTIIFLLGLFYLHKIVLIISKDYWYSLIIPLLFFTSPVLVYYGNNFLTNTSALSFSVISWYHVVYYIQSKKKKHLWYFLLFSFLAASFKITALISFFAIGVVVLINGLGKRKNYITSRPWQLITGMALVVGLVFSWVLYAKNQNGINECYYFSTKTFPIWDLDKEGIMKVWNNIDKFWFKQYFHSSMHILNLITFGFLLVKFNKIPVYLRVVFGMIFIQFISFIALQYWTFKDHDYYTIGLFIFPIYNLCLGLFLLKSEFNKVFQSKILKIALSILLIFNISYAKSQINERYAGWWNDISKFNDLHTITPYLEAIGLDGSDTVIIVPDNSHVSLYLINHKGWTNYIESKFNKGDKYRFNSDSITIEESIEKGASKLFVNGISNLYEKEYLQTFCSNLIAKYKDVLIFDLTKKGNVINYRDKTLHSKYYNGAELDQNADVSGTVGNSLFRSARGLSYSVACSLNANNPYGLTVRMKDYCFGDSIVMRVWVKNSENAKGTLVSSLGTHLDYSSVVQDSLPNGWFLIESNYVIDHDNYDDELVLYLFNDGEGEALFADYQIDYHRFDFLNIYNSTEKID